MSTIDAYQRALALAIAHGGGEVPGVRCEDVARLAAIAARKRLAAVRATLPRMLAALGREEFDRRYRAFAAERMPCGPEGYREEAIAFARRLGGPVARREARLAAAHGPGRSFAAVRDGRRLTLLARFRNGSRLHVVQLGR
ncbi:MAG TPA: hypothetical protein VK665_14725 [Candidatus Elarobacter sp.]|nr:hypothetical protein [Candidatus Elarobacter sp.]